MAGGYSRLVGRFGDVLMGRPNPNRWRPSPLRVWIVCSLLTALSSLLLPWIFGSPGQPQVEVSCALSVLWAGIVICAVWRFGRRGCWTLLGLPVALLWPAGIALVYAACEWEHDCI